VVLAAPSPYHITSSLSSSHK